MPESQPTIEERLQSLEQAEKDFTAESVRSTKLNLNLWAQLATLAQFAQEVAAHEGLDVQQFQQRMLAAFQWHHAQRLGRVEGIDPSFAAHIDDRTPDAISTDELPPPIFPPLEMK